MSPRMGVITVDRLVNLAKLCIGPTKAKTPTSKQTNEPRRNPHCPIPLPLAAFMPLFFSPSFFVSPSTPIWCMWTWHLGANSLPWTPSAVWLSSVNWAWLAIKGRGQAALSPVLHTAFYHPASFFSEQHWRVWRKGCLSSISTWLIRFFFLSL